MSSTSSRPSEAAFALSSGLTRRIDRRFKPEASLCIRGRRNGPRCLIEGSGGIRIRLQRRAIPWEQRRPLAHPSLSVSDFSLPDMRFRPVSARPSLSQKLKKEPDRFFLPREMMLPPLTLRADTTPSTDETCLAEQVGLDRHGIIAGHVFPVVDAFDIDLVGLCNHETENRTRRTPRPTTYLNRSALIDSC